MKLAIEAAIREAVAAEREACARVAEEHRILTTRHYHAVTCPKEIAAAIRARGAQP